MYALFLLLIREGQILNFVSLQISIDIFILGQVIVFRGRGGGAESSNALPHTFDENATPPHHECD